MYIHLGSPSIPRLLDPSGDISSSSGQEPANTHPPLFAALSFVQEADASDVVPDESGAAFDRSTNSAADEPVEIRRAGEKKRKGGGSSRYRVKEERKVQDGFVMKRRSSFSLYVFSGVIKPLADETSENVSRCTHRPLPTHHPSSPASASHLDQASQKDVRHGCLVSSAVQTTPSRRTLNRRTMSAFLPWRESEKVFFMTSLCSLLSSMRRQRTGRDHVDPRAFKWIHMRMCLRISLTVHRKTACICLCTYTSVMRRLSSLTQTSSSLISMAALAKPKGILHDHDKTYARTTLDCLRGFREHLLSRSRQDAD